MPFPDPDLLESSPPSAPGAKKVIAVGGGRGGVGKSVVASNLAVYFAQLGRPVVLVDCDPTGANVHCHFGVPAGSTAPEIGAAWVGLAAQARGIWPSPANRPEVGSSPTQPAPGR